MIKELTYGIINNFDNERTAGTLCNIFTILQVLLLDDGINNQRLIWISALVNGDKDGINNQRLIWISALVNGDKAVSIPGRPDYHASKLDNPQLGTLYISSLRNWCTCWQTVQRSHYGKPHCNEKSFDKKRSHIIIGAACGHYHPLHHSVRSIEIIYQGGTNINQR